MIKPQYFILASAVLLFLVVLNLVRQRRLREEYSWLWLAAAFFYLVMALKPELTDSIAKLFGITNAITAFIFFGLLFIVLILIENAVALSKLNAQMKNVAQQIAILDGEHLQTNSKPGARAGIESKKEIVKTDGEPIFLVHVDDQQVRK